MKLSKHKRHEKTFSQLLLIQFWIFITNNFEYLPLLLYYLHQNTFVHIFRIDSNYRFLLFCYYQKLLTKDYKIIFSTKQNDAPLWQKNFTDDWVTLEFSYNILWIMFYLLHSLLKLLWPVWPMMFSYEDMPYQQSCKYVANQFIRMIGIFFIVFLT